MRYLPFLIIAAALYHTLSYAKYNWDNQNVSAAAGAVIMALVALVLPLVVMYIVG
ncbi:MAG TPA: hypothetical protein PK728_10515 [Bacillota bacterium]|nr:hypothetical protein [Bacillota bacterium]